MIASERKLHILKQLSVNGVIDLKSMARSLDISEETVRRDFEKLEQAGKLIRVQGGAMLNEGEGNKPDSVQSTMSAKKNLNRAEKRMVAERAAQIVKDGDSVFLDCGTSLAPLAEILLKRNVRIVSNNTLLLQYDASSSNLFLLGGQYKSEYNLTFGQLTKRMVREFHFDHAFVGCFGFSMEQGKAYTLEVDSAEIKLAGMEHADHCHLLADGSKAERRGFYGYADLTRFENIFCEKDGVVEILQVPKE